MKQAPGEERRMKRPWRLARSVARQRHLPVGSAGGTKRTNSCSRGPIPQGPWPPFISRHSSRLTRRNRRSTALYVSVSTQRPAQQQTSDQQLARLREWCADQAGEVRDEFVLRDDGVSGSTLRRPGLDALRDAVAVTRCDCIVLTAPDRLARNSVHHMLLLEAFEQAGCRVVFLDRPMSQDPHDPLLLQMRGAVAEYERVLLTERMRRGRRHRFQAGVRLPCEAPPVG